MKCDKCGEELRDDGSPATNLRINIETSYNLYMGDKYIQNLEGREFNICKYCIIKSVIKSVGEKGVNKLGECEGL